MPSYLRIRLGDAVEWRMENVMKVAGRRHLVQFENMAEESDLMSSTEQRYRLTFSELGSYEYRCGIQARMRGVIEVTSEDLSAIKIEENTFIG